MLPDILKMVHGLFQMTTVYLQGPATGTPQTFTLQTAHSYIAQDGVKSSVLKQICLSADLQGQLRSAVETTAISDCVTAVVSKDLHVSLCRTCKGS